MRFPVRVFFRSLSFLLIFFLLLPTVTSIANAQTPPPAAYQFTTPNIDPDVPRNQHTFIQSLFLEVLLAVQCQLTGIDLSNPSQSCLGLNLQTGKIGYAPSPNISHQGNIQIGGLLGIATKGISTMYTPTFGSREYFNYLSDNFGLVKQTHAEAYTGFQGLQPVLEIWKTMRDLAYYLLIIAFIFIGIGVMLRLKIDPRTVMTVQNQIPRVIICIILITFSYAFAGLLIDTMWAVTYMGINKITQNTDPVIDTDNGKTIYLRQAATNYLLDNPYRYVNEIFDTDGSGGGILGMGWGVSQVIGTIENDVIINLFFGPTAVTSQCVTRFSGLPTGFNIGGCFQNVLSWVLGLLWFFVIAVSLLITLFRIWLELVKAYILVLLYVILAPIWIVFGLLPKRPLGFEKWLRVFFSNLAVFPAVVFILVGARVLYELFGNSPVIGAGTETQYRFVPPLVGNPDTPSFGTILEYCMVLMAPQLLNIIREKMGAAPNKQVSAAFQSFTAARGAVGAPVKQLKKHLNKRDAQGNAIGPLASQVDKFTKKLSRMPGIGGMLVPGHDKNEWVKAHYSMRGFKEAEELMKGAKGMDANGKQHKSVTEWADAVGFNREARGGGISHADAEKMGIAKQVEKLRGMPYSDEERARYGGMAPRPVAGGPSAAGQAEGTGGTGAADLTIKIIGPDGEQKINFNQAGAQQTVRDVFMNQAPHLIPQISQYPEASQHLDTPARALGTEGRDHLQAAVDQPHSPS